MNIGASVISFLKELIVIGSEIANPIVAAYAGWAFSNAFAWMCCGIVLILIGLLYVMYLRK